MRSVKWSLTLVVVGMLAACGGNNADNNENNTTPDMAMMDDMSADADMTDTPDEGVDMPDDMTDTPDEGVDMPDDMDQAINVVEVADQTLGDASQVVIARVVAEQDGYIVIHSQDANGDLVVEPAVGVVAVSAGEATDVVIDLDRPAVDGETLYAMLHTEDNGNDTYDGAGTDTPVTDADGDVIAPSFTVTVDAQDVATVVVSDQTLVDPLKVTIARVFAEKDGYIVIHEQDANGDLVVAPAIGAAAVSAGETLDLEITLQRLAVNGETLYAMLHSEENGNDSYDGAGTDTPVTDANGDVITPSFTVMLDMTTPDVIVEAQTADPANMVVVRQITAAQDGYIVIHEQNEAGMLVAEPAVGVAEVSAGINDDVSVMLTRPVLDGETLYAMLHTEDNANGAYDGPAVDAPVLDESGAVITPPFIVTAGTSEPFVTVYDQTATAANEVSIRQVLYANEGFVVIHEDNAGSPGAVIGSAAVSAGVTSDLVITLDRPALDGEVLHAMLHRDSNNDGIYDGVMIDPPVMNADMDLVSPTFIVSSNAENAVMVMDQSPLTVSTKVLISEVYAKADGYIVIHEQDSNGGILVDPPVGVAEVSAGVSSNFEVTLTRPAVNGETLYAMLHTEDNGNSTYDGPAVDAPATDNSGDVVAPAFAMTVTANTPAIIFTVNSSGAAAYVFAGVEPSLYAMDIGGGVGTQNPTLVMREGWRYRFDLGSTAVGHPIKFVDETMFGGDDLLVQGDGPSGPYEQDQDVAWLDLNNSVSFTVAPSTLFGGISNDLDYYECVNHPNMTGAITIITP